MSLFYHTVRQSTSAAGTTKPNRLRLEMLESRQMMSAAPWFNAGVVGETVGIDETGGNTVSTPGSIPVVQELALNSKPGAPATLFLDFNGHYQHERVGMPEWLSTILPGTHGWDHIHTPAFDLDGNPTTFSPQEQEQMRFIWASVAEDYAPFNINVTTIDPDPGNFHPERPYLRVVISGGDNFTGVSALEGGFAEYDAYAKDDAPNVVYVFGKDGHGNSFDDREIAEAASHEAGHAFGLRHYLPGTGGSSRQPIMEGDGASSALRGTWHSGLVHVPTGSGYILVKQDDMAVIANSDNGFGYRPDDHANGVWGASQLTINSVGLFGRGVIEKTSDVDTFQFTTGGGSTSIIVEEARTGFKSVGNLDVKIRLLDAAGQTVVDSDTPGILMEYWNGNLAAGTYYLQVMSHGAYGDVGQFTVSIEENSGPRVVSSRYYNLSPTLAGVMLTFNEPINPLTFTTHDVRINSGAFGAGVVSIGAPTINSTTFLVTIQKPATTSSMLKVSVGPKITDYFGNSMDQNRNGISGEAADYYFASFMPGGSKTTATGTKTTRMTTMSSVDAMFARY